MLWPQESFCGVRRPVVVHEPVSSVIGLTALISSTIGSSVTIAGVAITASQIGGAIVGIAGSLALSAANGSMQRRQNSSVPSLGVGTSVESIEQNLRQTESSPLPDQRLALGTAIGAFSTCLTRSKPPYIWMQGVLASHRCGPLLAIYVNGVRVPLDASGLPTAPPFYDGSTHYLEVSYRNGLDGQALDPIIARDIPEMPASFRQRGHTVATVKLHYGNSDAHHKDLYGSGGQANLLFEFVGAPYIDLRVPGCSISDPDTWVHGSNASLNIGRYLYHPWPDMRLVDPGQLNWDYFCEGADIDDLWRSYVKDDGTLAVERNHTVDGIIVASADPRQTITSLLTACDGKLIVNRGKYHVLPGHPRAPIGTLSQDMLAAGFDVQLETPDRDLINTIKTEFLAPGRESKPAVGPVLTFEHLIALDGRPLETTLSLAYTLGDPRAQRLARRKMIESRGGDGNGSQRISFSGVWSRAARNYKAGDIVRLFLRDFTDWNGIYEIQRTAPDLNAGTVQIDMLSFDKRRFDHNALTNQRPFTLSQTVLSAEAA